MGIPMVSKLQLELIVQNIKQVNAHWKYLHGHEIPCAVCRIPRNNVLMVPGKNRCHDNYMLEYKGYLMGEHHGHVSFSEYVCVDENPETL
jgi:hypothetical protein